MRTSIFKRSGESRKVLPSQVF